MAYSIALDGPGGAGKSSIAKKIAADLGIVYVDTGAMYRAVALYMLENDIDISDEQFVHDNLSGVDIKLAYKDGTQMIYLCGKDVSADIRRPAVSMAASVVSAYPAVRAFLLAAQRDVARVENVIMDGRDIGTVVLPNAQVKIFMMADSRVRAQRRYKELLEKGDKAAFETVLADIEKRDWRDIHRAASPLKQAEDAILLDTTHLTFEESVQSVKNIIREKLGDKI